MIPTIAIIAAGAMGSAIAERLTRHGAKVLTSLEGRGPQSRARAAAAGMQHVDDQRLVDEAVGAASALKLSYAGITKGLVAIASAMILAADRAGAGPALKVELAASQPQLLARFAKTLPDMYPKAYRWVEEMHAISEFIGEEFPEALIYKGAAGLYE